MMRQGMFARMSRRGMAPGGQPGAGGGMRRGVHGGGRGGTSRAIVGSVVLLIAVGSFLLGDGVASQVHAPALPHDLALPVPAQRALASPSAVPLTLARSRPWFVSIPAIGVRSGLLSLGLNANQTIQVPPLTSAGVHEAGWYRLGPTPGEAGAAIILGHVDSYRGPGVFFRLGAMRPGDTIQVLLVDGIAATFTVDAVDQYTKAQFPSQQVYGPVGYAGLRLITCGGAFDPHTRQYLSNIVVYATLTGVASLG